MTVVGKQVKLSRQIDTGAKELYVLTPTNNCQSMQNLDTGNKYAEVDFNGRTFQNTPFNEEKQLDSITQIIPKEISESRLFLNDNEFVF